MLELRDVMSEAIKPACRGSGGSAKGRGRREAGLIGVGVKVRAGAGVREQTARVKLVLGWRLVWLRSERKLESEVGAEGPTGVLQD